MLNSLLLLALLLAEPGRAIYRGEVWLPVELYTASGESIPSGKRELEIRSEGDDYILVFLSGEKRIASVHGKRGARAEGFSIPLVGTILLSPVKISPTKSSISPYLTNLSWSATLRLYKASEPASRELRAIFRDKAKRVEFPLLSEQSKPGTP
jgi:hypothetical protein